MLQVIVYLSAVCLSQSVSQSFCLSVSHSFSQSVSQSVCLSVCHVCLSVCLSVSQSVCLSCLSVCLSLCLSVCLSVCLFLSVCLSVCLFVSVCLSVSLSLSLCLPLCLSVLSVIYLSTMVYADPEDYLNQFVTRTLSPNLNRQCINITIIQDTVVEDQESFLVRLSSNDPSAALTLTSAEVFIADSSSKYIRTIDNFFATRISCFQ